MHSSRYAGTVGNPSLAISGESPERITLTELAVIVGQVMPMLFRTSRLSAGAAISVAAACALAANASAQVSAPLLIGPDHVGSAVTYRLTTSGGRAEAAPNVQTLALRWKLGQKVVVTLTSAGDAQATPTPYVATRAPDGTLMLDNVSPDDPEGQRLALAVGVLNRLDGFVAAAPPSTKSWKTTLVVQVPAPRGTPAPDAPAPQSTQAPQPLKIPVAATRSDDATGTTLAASGSIDRTLTRPAGSPRGGGGGGGGMGGGMGRRGGMGGMGGGGMGGMGGGMGGMGGGMGGMGGGGMGGRMGGSSSGPKSIKVTTKITVGAHFGRDGELTSGTIVETNQAADQSQQNQQDQPDGQSQPNPQSQPSTRSWEIERTP
jgi:hypothetical protein